MDPNPVEGRTRTKVLHAELCWKIVGGAIAVHSHLGPGLLEGAYRRCLVRELGHLGLRVEVEKPIDIAYRGETIRGAFRADLVVEDVVLLELKAVSALTPIHDAQMLTYLKLSKVRVGYLFNFHTRTLRDGIRRFVR